MPERRIPRPFSMPWGRGMVVEEADIEGGLHQPSLQLLRYEFGKRKASMRYGSRLTMLLDVSNNVR